MIRGDFHVHSTYSDGDHSLEQMVQAAVAKGFTALGLTDHAYMDDPNRDWGMKKEAIPAYLAEIARLKEQYRGKIDLLCGIEQDYFSPLGVEAYDYAIGSVHAVEKNGILCEVDDSLENVKKNLALFADPYEYTEEYFKLVGSMPQKFQFEIVGHFDLVAKWQQKCPLFDEAHPRYRAAAEDALQKLIPIGALFEVNVGGISRGSRTMPYPNPALLRSIYERGGQVILCGDCHNADYLGLGFDVALALVKQCGFERIVTLTSGGRQFLDL